uniref:ATP-dependent Clp protease proteolytic subunit n=1 Tax=uncultured bacterium Contig643 TaxID=1393602 RepID=W0FMS2_9BACT|nr:peptidase S14 ClpP [uncultured bacterium Contig643]
MMARKQKYYQITTSDRVAEINIYGDITSWPWLKSDVSSFDIKQEIDGLDVDEINIFINSYGGEVAEALAIYSALKRHSAKVHTYCDGFACSAATIIFCAGDTRTMGSIALMMIHNCMSYLGFANSEEMRKAAEDNDKINQSSIEAYKKVSNLSEEEIKEMMSSETWLTAQECLEYGFATEIADDDDEEDGPQQSAFGSIRAALLNRQAEDDKAIEKKLDAILAVLQEEKTEDPEPAPQKEEEADQDPEEEPGQPEQKLNKVGNIFSLFTTN